MSETAPLPSLPAENAGNGRAGRDPTPLMRQYHALKAKNPGALLFFRLGDFYELFEEDARRAAPILELVLTQRQGIPMCGLPHHALPAHLSKLLKKGLRVAIAEQLEDPAAATALAGSVAGERPKGMVARDVVRVVTPGTLLEDELLPAKQNNFLAALYPGREKSHRGEKDIQWGLAVMDLSTGDLLHAVLTSSADKPGRLAAELSRLDPKELLLPPDAAPPFKFAAATVISESFRGDIALYHLTKLFGASAPEGFGLTPDHPALPALGALLHYVESTQAAALAAAKPPRRLALEDHMVLDELAVKRLELLPTPEGTSLWDVLDHTETPMGGRRLKWWLLHPLLDPAAINDRLEKVDALLRQNSRRKALSLQLREAADVERVLSRFAAGTASGRDAVALRRTLGLLPGIAALFREDTAWAGVGRALESLTSALAPPPVLIEFLGRALADDPPFRLSDGGIIRDGFSAALDELRSLARSGRSWISEREAEERRATGISSLKIGFTSVFGYYLEVSRTHLAKVPPSWIRKQTVANGERFITPELKTMEDRILGADEKSRALERELFARVRRDVLVHRDALRAAADALAELDALASLAEAAERGGYQRPRVDRSDTLSFRRGRHPVVERALSAAGSPGFVPNDAVLDVRDNQILLITGPNMGGKSTYLRQTALIALMAQMGSFVPAEDAVVGVVDRIFTRIGAGDNLSGGASTFMVEMQEVANILHSATERSLVILDEVGRGTSTFDGVAVAGAVVEHLARRGEAAAKPGADAAPAAPRTPGTGPKTLFATHYFELTSLAGRFPHVKNFHAAVKEWTKPDGKTELVFLHEIRPGPADRSYGVHVAQMAGLPAAVVERSKSLLKSLEAAARPLAAPAAGSAQQELFDRHPALEELRGLDPEGLTPLEALQRLYALVEKAKPPT